MSRKLSQAEAKQKSLDVGIKMLGEYDKISIKTTFECPECDKHFECIPNSVWLKRTKSCGCLNRGRDKITQLITQLEARAKSDVVGVKMLGRYVNNKVKTKFECPNCHKDWVVLPNNVWRKNSVSCGCQCGTKKITQAEAEKKSLDVGVKMTGEYVGNKVKTKFECPNCCEDWMVNPNNVWTKRNTSCGNCRLYVNGRRSSGPQREVQEMIDKLINEDGFPNHNIVCGSKTINVDIAYIIDYIKIVVEYDEWVWHGLKQEKDNKRLQKIRDGGWKTLQIRAHGNIPTEDQLGDAMYKLISTNSHSETITLEGWGVGPTRFE